MKTETMFAETDSKTIPSLEFVQEIAAILSQNIEEEEANRKISSSTLNALREAGLLRLYLPKSFGGSETDPLTTAKLVEAVARHNTAAGWSMMVANTSAWWCKYLPEKGVEEVFKYGPDTFVAGAFHPPMRASATKSGFLINGRSPLTSNVHEAQWIFVTAFVMDGDQMKFNNGIPEVIGVIMDAKDVEVLDTWYTIGMKSTDSNDIKVDNVFVPDHRLFALMPDAEPNSYYKSPLYRFPAIGVSISSLISPVALAVARNAIEELKVIADKKVPLGSMVSIKERGAVQRKLGMAEAFVQSSRAFLFQELTGCWKKVQAKEKISLEEKARLLLAATQTNQSCSQAVDLMYTAAGTTGIYTRNKLSRLFSDAQVIRQHGFSNESRYETAAQVFLGLQPDLPVIAF